VAETPPIVSVAVRVPALPWVAVRCTVTVCPFVTVPVAAVYAPPLMLYSAFAACVEPTIEIPAGALIPDTVMVFDVIIAPLETPVRAVKVKASGVVSTGAATVVTLKLPATPPIVTVAVVVVE
jgi:hypothetical protein